MVFIQGFPIRPSYNSVWLTQSALNGSHNSWISNPGLNQIYNPNLNYGVLGYQRYNGDLSVTNPDLLGGRWFGSRKRRVSKKRKSRRKSLRKYKTIGGKKYTLVGDLGDKKSNIRYHVYRETGGTKKVKYEVVNGKIIRRLKPGEKMDFKIKSKKRFSRRRSTSTKKRRYGNTGSSSTTRAPFVSRQLTPGGVSTEASWGFDSKFGKRKKQDARLLKDVFPKKYE